VCEREKERERKRERETDRQRKTEEKERKKEKPSTSVPGFPKFRELITGNLFFVSKIGNTIKYFSFSFPKTRTGKS
jgi:hypothetical protein